MTVEQLLQVFAVTRDIVGNMRILDDVVAHERGQGRHADELVGLVEREEDGIDAFSLEKLFRIGKCLMRCVPCDGEHVFFVPEQTAGTVSASAVGTGTAIAFIEFAMSCRENVVDVFFHDPGGGHPPGGHLVNHGIGPEQIGNFRIDIVVVIDTGRTDFLTEGDERLFGDQGEMIVQIATGIAKAFGSIEDENMVHGISRKKFRIGRIFLHERQTTICFLAIACHDGCAAKNVSQCGSVTKPAQSGKKRCR